MKAISLLVLCLSVSACGFQWQTKEDAPVGNYKKVHHTITFDTEPQCVGSCNPSVKSW
jgi:outer membrane lipopolysaccharide assembly protein LptE/RlpB